MIPYSSVFLAEVLKLFSRSVARVGAVLFVGVGVVAPVVMSMTANSGFSVNDQDVQSTMDLSAPNAVLWSLYLRNFFIAHVLTAVLAALSFAGELRDHTLREDLVRPVPRSVVLAAKWAALAAWSAVTLGLQLAAALIVAAVLHPWDGAAKPSWFVLGFFASWLCDLGFAAFALAAATVLRSVSGALTGVVLFIVFEWTASWIPFVVRPFVEAMDPATVSPLLRMVVDSAPFYPSAAWGAWQQVASGASPTWQLWAALAVYTAVAAVVAERVFSRIDIP
jgi:ABC-type transport system involved in multi-copper enzyme maturation permease subunit